ncbi:MAG TPA: hypothetical protein VHA33_19445 [Candidatus Angelobacter sp.]|jgi:hypothetical protein|nr:hypothetical protein [Candidatus Angelobacter sp.]
MQRSSRKLTKLTKLISEARTELLECQALLGQLTRAERQAQKGSLGEKSLWAIYRAVPPEWKIRGGGPAIPSPTPRLRKPVKLATELNKILILVQQKHR